MKSINILFLILSIFGYSLAIDTVNGTLLATSGYTTFSQLVENVGYEGALSTGAVNVSFFAVSDALLASADDLRLFYANAMTSDAETAYGFLATATFYNLGPITEGKAVLSQAPYPLNNTVRFDVYNGVKTVNGAAIVGSVACTNGILYFVDKLVLPTINLATLNLTGASQYAQLTTVFEFAGPLLAGLPGSLSVTFLAPTNTAMTSSGFLTLSTTQQTDTLEFLGLSGVFYSKSFTNASTPATLYQSSVMPVTVSGTGNIQFGYVANIVIPDIPTTIGAVHVIDNVVFPFTVTTGSQVTTGVQVTTGTSPVVTGSTSSSSFLSLNILLIIISLLLQF